jgi:hypothetical protein
MNTHFNIDYNVAIFPQKCNDLIQKINWQLVLNKFLS